MMARGKVIQPDDQLGFLLFQTTLLKLRITNTMLKTLGLTYMQFVILAGIYELKDLYDGVSQQLLVSERRLDKAMVSCVLKKLIGKGLVVRESNPSDSRSWLLKLSGPGEQLAVRARNQVHKLNDEFFCGIEQVKLKEILKCLLNQRDDGKNI